MAENILGTDTPESLPHVPEKPALEGLEDKLQTAWQSEEIYRFDPDTTREAVYSIDTPPPTASGSLHVGHIFSYTQTDVMARFARMRGKNVFYPMGWDDNGLPTERRVQNYFGVRVDPTLPYNPDYQPPASVPKNQRDFEVISRNNFIELCERLATEDERVFKDIFSRLGLSVDWDLNYRTIDSHSRAVAQRAFLGNLENGDAYMALAPTLWDVTFRTAVAQAELEDREVPGAYYRYGFTKNDGDSVYIETTRPELLAACVALVAHPDDERYQDLFGTTVTSPLFGVDVPVKAHPLAKPDKGSGIAMVCTFGDLTDVTWWRELDLPTRAIIGRDGRVLSETPEWITTEEGVENYGQLAGLTVFSAKQKVADLLSERGLLDGEPRKITHPVNFFEKGEKPLEVVTSRQWYLRNGGRDAERRERLIERGRQIDFHPSFMRSRYENWVEGLNGDWLVSRQRFFGVPIPVWYPVDQDGEPDYEHPILPENSALPVDPAAEAPAGYREEQRGIPGGFVGDPDVLDTWATSSLTPQIMGGWSVDEALFERVFPFDLRPQGHDIIRTWLFSTIVRADALQDQAPWKNAAISGWILDPDRKKMSKSKGNVVVPTEALDQFGSDAVRYWAASAKLGADTAYETAQMKIGRRLAIKLLNASKFVLGLGATEADILGEQNSAKVNSPVDRSLIAALVKLEEQATALFDTYDYARALSLIESFFWQFTDDYVELVKDRAYGSQGEGEEGQAARESALIALATTVDALLKLLAPILPFVTDEVWRWWRPGSVHASGWVDSRALAQALDSAKLSASADEQILAALGTALAGIRKAKSEAKVKQRTPVVHATINAPEAILAKIEAGLTDLKASTNTQELDFAAAEQFSVSDVELALEAQN